MKIYTKTGDQGQTSLWGGQKVYKDEIRIQAYGTVDELCSCLGVVLSEVETLSVETMKVSQTEIQNLRSEWTQIQNQLFQLGSELATPKDKNLSVEQVGSSEIANFEQSIDKMELKLEPLKNFILPGGHKIASLLHLARTIARRAERHVVTLHRAEGLRPQTIQYLNRLSDYLFVCARFTNALFGRKDIPWTPSKTV